MDGAVDLWMRMYRGEAPWLSSEVVGLNLPAFIASEVARLSTVEFESRVTGGARAAFLNRAYQRALPSLRQAVEYAAASGSVVMKPYADGRRIGVDFVRAGLYCPTAYDASGTLTGCAFLDRATDGEAVYTRVEYHEMEQDGVRIRNLCFRAKAGDDGLGEAVPLSSVSKWADMLPEALVTGVKRPLFALLTMPHANHVEPGNPMGVSCYARAVDLIREADKQFSRLLWEMESGQRALYVDIRAFSPEETVPGSLPFKRFYRTMDAGAAPEEASDGDGRVV